MKSASEIDQMNKSAKQYSILRRLGALVIDFIVLAIIGYLTALIGKDFFVKLGNHGVLVGWLISTIYFAIFNSKAGGSQSPGKRAMNIQVINNDGTPLSLLQGLTRSLLFTSPYFLFDYIGDMISQPTLSTVFSILNVSYYLGLAYFFLVSKDRRTVHDFIANTIVKHQREKFDTLVPLSKLKIYIFIGIVVSVLGGFTGVYIVFKDTTTFLIKVIDANVGTLVGMSVEISELDHVVRVESSKIHVDVQSEVGIVVEVWVNEDVNTDEANVIYEKIMDIIASQKFDISRIDYAEIVLMYGYDIGIADYKISRTWKEQNKTGK
jgi:uncharacterized RDD family membrane protein YckC